MTFHSETIQGTIQLVAADGRGSLDGFEFRCSVDGCGERASFSMESLTLEHARSHTAFMVAKERAPKRGRRR